MPSQALKPETLRTRPQHEGQQAAMAATCPIQNRKDHVKS
jgi:hypothetical protein